MTDFADRNLFEMFVANDEQPGFWLQRTTWGNSCARVTSVGPLTGPAPYYGNPKVHAGIFDLTTGELREHNARLSAAGTYKTWRRSIRLIGPEFAHTQSNAAHGHRAC